MKQKKIRLKSMDEARAFVNAAMKCDFDVNVFYNRVIIDAKSILGVMSLDFTKVLTVEYNGTNEAFETFLDELAADVEAA